MVDRTTADVSSPSTVVAGVAFRGACRRYFCFCFVGSDLWRCYLNQKHCHCVALVPYNRLILCVADDPCDDGICPGYHQLGYPRTLESHARDRFAGSRCPGVSVVSWEESAFLPAHRSARTIIFHVTIRVKATFFFF